MARVLKKTKYSQQGSLLVTALVFSFVFIILGGALMGLIVQQWKTGQKNTARIQALQIAEAGINYYKWHLDAFEDDYADGTGQIGCNPCGPYVHNFEDPSASLVGQFELFITPPLAGSTVVKIKSTGWTQTFPNIKRYIAVRYGKPSWARFAVIANTDMRFGTGTIVHGPIHSNGGSRFDGIAYNEITSGVDTYTDTDGDACTASSWGVHTCVSPQDPAPPTVVPPRPDVFIGGRRYPVPQIDFNSVTADLAQLKSDAEDDGLYINPSPKQGYHLQFQSDGTLRYRVVKDTGTCNGGASPMGDIDEYQGSWTTETIPSNGIIFVEDNMWIDGTVTNGHITVVAAVEPLATGLAEVWINNDILYAAKDGTAGLGIIAQNNISIGLFSEDNLEIDAVLLAQKGRVGRYYYPSSCDASYYQRDTVSMYGTIASYERYGFSWECGGVFCSGYETRNIDYDTFMVYSPPPLFPTSGEYTFISWEELLPGETY